MVVRSELILPTLHARIRPDIEICTRARCGIRWWLMTDYRDGIGLLHGRHGGRIRTVMLILLAATPLPRKPEMTALNVQPNSIPRKG
jgi:hypothetical protein